MKYPDNAQAAAGVELTRHGVASWDAGLLAIGPHSTLSQNDRNVISKLMLAAQPHRRSEVLKLNPEALAN